MPCKKAIPESALLRQAGGRPMVAPTFSIWQSRCFSTRWAFPLWGRCPRLWLRAD